jgi:hypothetical protein
MMLLFPGQRRRSARADLPRCRRLLRNPRRRRIDAVSWFVLHGVRSDTLNSFALPVPEFDQHPSPPWSLKFNIRFGRGDNKVAAGTRGGGSGA